MTAAPLLALCISAAALWLLLHAAARLPHAHPSGRSLHAVPVPRVGGLAIWAGVVPVLAIAHPPPGLDVPAAVALYAGTAAIALVSLLDDWRGMPTMVRLAVHAGAAVAFAMALDRAPVSVPLIGATALVLVWVANLYNFMDGSDCIAGVMTLCGFVAYGAAATINGDSGTVYFCIAAATVPFLFVNVPPARMFLGDVGAVPLGFLAAAFGLAGIRGGAWPAWLPWLVFLPFVADATVTLARRVARGERVWEAHKSHYYQRLHQMGAGHWGTAVVYGALAVGTALTAVACVAWAPDAGWKAIAVWIAVHAMLFATIDYHWHRRTRDKRKSG